jgi:sigma-54 dependent transcriptional regulator, acetoin dehydrogenase operon transcriptional activator AcoR
MRSEWPASLPTDPRSLHAAREDMLSRGLLAPRQGQPALRPIIERSWRRCMADAVPTVRSEIAHSDLATMTIALRDAAAPVVDRMSEHLGALRVGLFVSNDRGQILLRQVEEPQHRRILDRAFAAEGFDFSEVSVGTNGMGTVLVERQPVLVHGAEHYSDLLENVTCAATPIFEPFTRRLLGTFSIACASRDASPLMYGLTTDVGRQIESNLASMLGAREQALIRAYLMAEHSSRDPVLVLTDRTVFANTVGVPHLDSTSHALLWDHLNELVPSADPVVVRLPLSGGWREALVETVEGSRGQQPAWCIRLLPERPHRPDDKTAVPAAPAKPRTLPRRQAVVAVSSGAAGPSDLIEALDERRTLALEGAAGTGKLYQARRLLAGADPLVLDVSTFRPTDGGSWSERGLDAVAGGRPVVLRHLQDLHPRDVNRVLALATAAASGTAAAGLVLTWDATDSPDHVWRLVRRAAPEVRLPALANDPRRVAELVTHLLDELAAPGQHPHLSSDALQCLMRWTWPGNVEELRTLLLDLCHDFAGHVVRQTDLPAHLQRTPQRRTVTLMESAEREAIVTALQQAGGNRSRAANVLGIGRTTLYRKMQQLRIDS